MYLIEEGKKRKMKEDDSLAFPRLFFFSFFLFLSFTFHRFACIWKVEKDGRVQRKTANANGRRDGWQKEDRAGVGIDKH